jgi:hypothetical protein
MGDTSETGLDETRSFELASDEDAGDEADQGEDDEDDEYDDED